MDKSGDEMLIESKGTSSATRWIRNAFPAEQRKPIFTKVFKKGKRYILRLVNSSTKSDFVITIDNHLLEIITTDFVPIHPFKNESIHIGIGKSEYASYHMTTS